jgi:hypothetical protein
MYLRNNRPRQRCIGKDQGWFVLKFAGDTPINRVRNISALLHKGRLLER